MAVLSFPSSPAARAEPPCPLPADYLTADWWRQDEGPLVPEGPAPWEDRVDFLARTDPDVLEGPAPRPLAALFAALTRWLVPKDTFGISPEAGHGARRIDPVRSLHAG